MIYLDYAASTPIDDRVVSAMAPYHAAANPSSTHAAGREAADAVEQARGHVASLVGAKPAEIVFTSGATEADNLAIGGVIRAVGGGHIVTAASEHKAVLETVKEWCHDATVVPVNRDGSVDPSRIEAAIRRDTVLVSVMAANNEVGTVSPIQAVGELCRARDVLFHTDAAQAVGKIPIDVGSLPIDLLSISAHKIYGPKGIGALWIRREVRDRLKAVAFGGGHERGFRPGTTNVAGCVGFGEAARILLTEAKSDDSHCRALRRRLFAAVLDAFQGAQPNGSQSHCVPGIVNIRLPGLEAESLLLATPRVAASTGSACTSAVPTPSHVLLAMGLNHDAASESIRLSFGRFTTYAEIDETIEAFASAAVAVGESTAGLRA